MVEPDRKIKLVKNALVGLQNSLNFLKQGKEILTFNKLIGVKQTLIELLKEFDIKTKTDEKNLHE